MINKKILAVGIKNNNAFDLSKDGIALIDINNFYSKWIS